MSKVLPRRGSQAESNMAEVEAAAQPLIEDGWTVEGAWNHLQGICDPAVCGCGHWPGTERLFLVCNGCGEAFDSIETANEHYAVGTSSDSGVCADEGYVILPESEAM